jgi:lipoprotein-anchoring transpeptidase ErfK/SrfK
MVLKKLKTITLTIIWSVVFTVNPVQSQGLLDNLLKTETAKSNTKPSSGATKKPQSASSSKSDPSLLDLFSSKTPEERAKEEAARKKAADAKARLDAKNKATAAAEKKKADDLKAREQAARDKIKAQERAAELAQKQKEEAMEALQKKRADEQRAKDLAAREKQRASEKAAELLAKQKADAEKARREAEEEKAEVARKAALLEMRQKEEKVREILAAAREREAALREAADEKLRLQREADATLIAQAHGRTSRPFGGLFGSRSTRTNLVANQKPQVVSPPNRYLYINEREISRLNSANSRLEIDLGDQRARVYRGSILVIETQISSGKSGYSTPTGRFIIQEKLVDKQSGRYGTWYDSSGNELRGEDSFDPPPGGVQFVGADMPYWLRLTDGIGMHVGFVPDGPASHGCIRVPSNVQPLIYSKVGIGTPVLVRG